MTLTSTTSAPGVPVAAGQDPSPVRLQLKPEGPTTGFVDGAWWPRSRDLAAELPSLATALRTGWA